jgi:uncharacterized protein (TIGR03382 family)
MRDPSALRVQRDLFSEDLGLSFTASEDDLFFTLSATDLEASSSGHFYEIVPVDQPDGLPLAWATLDGGGCISLQGTHTDTQAELVMQIDKACLPAPLPAIETVVKRNNSSHLLTWEVIEEAGSVRCVALDDAIFPAFYLYQVGVRAGVETFYVELNLGPTVDPAPDAGILDAGVTDASVGPDATADPDGDPDGDGGCASAGHPAGLGLVLLGLLLLIWQRRRA